MKRHRVRNILITILLALVCVGGAELAACRHFEPEIYHRLTDPVVQGLHRAADWGSRSLASLAHMGSQLMDALAPEQEPEASPQPLPTQEPAVGSDPAITALEEQNGRELLTGGILPVVYFNQTDPAWAQEPYGTDTVASCGCGPTALAMAAATLTGVDCDPASMAQWAYENHHWARGDGSYLSIVSDCARDFGFRAEALTDRTPEALEDALYAGKLVVALMGPGHFTRDGHFILIRGCTLEGRLLIADPNSRANSLAEWDPQQLLDELSSKSTDGAPLWALSLPES